MGWNTDTTNTADTTDQHKIRISPFQPFVFSIGNSSRRLHSCSDAS